MEAMRVERESLATITRPVKLYPQRLDTVEVVDKKVAMESAELAEAKAKAEEYLAGDGRVLVRPSGTEQLIRVLAEAPDPEQCARANEIILAALEGFRP